MNLLLGGENENADSANIPFYASDSRRFARSNRKNDDSPNSSNANDDNQDLEAVSGSDDKKSAMIINEICKSFSDKEKSNNTSNSNQTPKEILLCQLLQKIARSPKKSGDAQGADQYLPENYNKYEAPKLKYTRVLRNRTVFRFEKPVSVEVFLNVRGIVDFNDDDGVSNYKLFSVL